MRTLNQQEIQQVSGGGNFQVPFTFSFAGDGLRRETNSTQWMNDFRPYRNREISFAKLR